ncbi:MAG: alpha/beta hydrolase [Pseudomonadota bacterium]
MGSDTAHENLLERLPDGTQVGLARYGQPGGLPILAFHGAPACRFMFDVADTPARDLGVELICPDRPGYGLTPPDAEPSLASRTQMHMALVEALGLERFHLLGISGGGPYAVALAAAMPDRVRGLGLVSPIGPVADFVDQGGRTVHPFHRWFFLRLPHKSRLLSVNGKVSARLFKRAPTFFARMFARGLGEADLAVLSRPMNQASLIRMTHEALRQGIWGATTDLQIFSAPWGVETRKIGCPTVIWQGTADRIVPASVSLALAETLPNCDAIRLAGHGHFWVYDHTDEVLSQLVNLG